MGSKAPNLCLRGDCEDIQNGTALVCRSGWEAVTLRKVCHFCCAALLARQRLLIYGRLMLLVDDCQSKSRNKQVHSKLLKCHAVYFRSRLL